MRWWRYLIRWGMMRRVMSFVMTRWMMSYMVRRREMSFVVRRRGMSWRSMIQSTQDSIPVRTQAPDETCTFHPFDTYLS